MSKPDKQVPKPDRVADKLRDASITDDNKPDTVNVDFGSPITPLQTRPSGLTSAATTTTTSSCSSSSSGSVTGRHGQTPLTRKLDFSRQNPSAAQSSKSSSPSAAQSGSSNPSATQSSKSSSPSTAQSGSSNPSATQSSKSSSPSTAQSGSNNPQSKPSIPSAAQTGSKNPAAAQSGSAAATHSKSSASSAAQSGSAAATHSKSSASSAAQSGSVAAQSKSTTPSATQSKSGIPAGGDKSSKSTTSSAAGSSNSPAGAKTGQSSTKTAAGNQKAGRGSATSDATSGTAKASGRSTPAPQQPIKILPAGNLFPSGKVQITGMTQGIPKSKVLAEVLGPGATSYGYGSIMRGNAYAPKKPKSSLPSPPSYHSISPEEKDTVLKIGMNNSNPEEVKKFANELYNISCFPEALKLYERAIELSPTTAKYHSNRAATLAALSRIGEAVIACEEAVKLDPKYAKAHHRLGALLLRLGQVDNAGKYFYSVEEPTDPLVASTLQDVDKHLNKCADARKRGEWSIVLTEASKAMASGADFSPQLALCKVEALLKLKQLDAAQEELECVPKVKPFPASFSQARFFDMLCEAYTSFVKSQMNLTQGRFENAVTAAEKASAIDPQNSEIEAWYIHVSQIAKARDRGNNLYESERYTEASAAYTEGLKHDPGNATLHCHRADCFFKVGRWESSIEDCNRALKIQPSLLKPLQQRAASYSKLEKWAEAVSDYEKLRKELPYDKDIAETLFYAQVSLRKSRGEVILNMEFGGEVEEFTSLVEFKSALTRPGVTVVNFFKASDQQCKEMSRFMEGLCIRYPSPHFLKVDIEKCPAVGDSESVRIVPTFKIYREGIRMKVIVCPSKEALENSVAIFCL